MKIIRFIRGYEIGMMVNGQHISNGQILIRLDESKTELYYRGGDLYYVDSDCLIDETLVGILNSEFIITDEFKSEREEIDDWWAVGKIPLFVSKNVEIWSVAEIDITFLKI